VNTETLIDAQAVAELLELCQRTSVSVYQLRYADTQGPPVVELGPGRLRALATSEIQSWARMTGGVVA
jgi:predicted DNA-binding transcriptional regulator AlpA